MHPLKRTGRNKAISLLFLLAAILIGCTISICASKPVAEGDLPHFYSGRFYFDNLFTGMIFSFWIFFTLIKFINILFLQEKGCISKRFREIILITGSIFTGLFLAAFAQSGNIKIGFISSYLQENLSMALLYWLLFSLFSYPFIQQLLFYISDKGEMLFKIACFSISVCFALILSSQMGELRWDTLHYYNCAMKYKEVGLFRLEDISFEIRGYFFPFILFSASRFVVFLHSDLQRMLFIISMLSCYSTYRVCSLLFPLLTDSRKGDKHSRISFFLRFTFVLLIIGIFWKDLFIYTATDSAATSLALIATTMIIQVISTDKAKENSIQFIPKSLGIGILLYGVYNTRTSYLVFCLFILLLLLLSFLYYKRIRIIASFVLIILGIIITGIPQSRYNTIINEYNTIKVLTPNSNQDNLFTAHLWGGRYYTLSISVPEEYTAVHCKYNKDRVDAIFPDLQTEAKGSIPLMLLKGFFNKPFDVINIYTNHFLAGLFVTSIDTVYEYHLSAPKFPFLFLGFSKYFAILLSFFIFMAQQRNCLKACCRKETLFLIPVILSTIATFFGAVETRFGFPIFLLSYIYLCFFINWRKLWLFIKRYPMQVTISFILILLLFLNCWSGILASCENQILFLN